MEMANVLLSVMVAGFTLNMGLIAVLWARIDKLSDKVDGVDQRLCRIEGALYSKDCCMLKDNVKTHTKSS